MGTAGRGRPKTVKLRDQERRKRKAAFWERVRAKRKWRLLLYFLIAILFFFGVGAAFAAAPAVRLVAAQLTKPKPIAQADVTLPASIQKAIETLAKEEITQEQASAVLAITTPETEGRSVFQPVVDAVQEAITFNPADKAAIQLRTVDRLLANLTTLLETDESDAAINRAVNLIQAIARERAKVAGDPIIQSDRELLTRVIEQYMRIQLTLQRLEERLPLQAYLKIDDAREEYLVKPVAPILSNDPNLAASINIGDTVIEQLIGEDFKELKDIEFLSDLEAGVAPDKRQLLFGLEKQLAINFEKRMLKLPRDVRERKLQDYIQYSYGNPLRQIQAFNRMKDFMSDREIILGLDSIKELALKKLEDRIFELNTQAELEQFLARVLQSPADIKILTEMQLDVNAGTDEERKQRLAEMQKNVESRLSQFFSTEEALQQYFTPAADRSPDLLDVLLARNIEDIISRSDVPDSAKQALREVTSKTLQSFVQTVASNDFISQPKAAYNPVSPQADVRVLLSNPAAIGVLRLIQSELSAADQATLERALRAQALLTQEHVLLQVNDPEVFAKYQRLVTTDQAVKQVMQTYASPSFFTALADKKKLIETADQKGQQKLYEKMQQITQDIFITSDTTLAASEKQLPESVQAEIQQLKQELASRTVPRLATPPGVTLPALAKLPDAVEQAIIIAAKARIRAAEKSEAAQLDLQVEAEDLGVREPVILPGNILYPLKEFLETVSLVITLDPIQRLEKAIDLANEKTLEAATLVQDSQSQETITTALDTLQQVSDIFDQLKEHAAELETIKQEEPAKVSDLVDQIIENGLARQTVLAAIEDQVTGDSYVAVETIRQEVLNDGIDTLLDLTDQDVPLLVDKLEQVIDSQSGSEFKEIKAVELLIEIERTQPAEVGEILDTAQETLAETVEETLLALPEAERTDTLLAYADSASGNPVKQFETYDTLKDYFDDPELQLLAEALKDQAAENLTERISEITDGTAQEAFVETIIGDQPEDLRIITDIELRVTPPETSTELAQALPLVEQIQDIKAAVEENIIETYQDNPQALAETELFSDPTHTETPDILDVETIQAITDILERTPEVLPAVIETAQEKEQEIITQFIDNAANLQVSTTTEATDGTETAASLDPIQVLEPVPEIIQILVDLKADASPEQQAQIDGALAAQVELIQEYLTTQVTDPTTFQTYVAQLTEDPVIAEVIAEVGGTDFIQAVTQTAEEIQAIATEEHFELETVVSELTQEIFSSSLVNPSPVEETLSVTVQEQIQEIKQDVLIEQIPEVTITETIEVTVPQEIQPVATPEPTSAPAEPTVEPALPTEAPVILEPVQTTTEPLPVVPGL